MRNIILWHNFLLFQNWHIYSFIFRWKSKSEQKNFWNEAIWWSNRIQSQFKFIIHHKFIAFASNLFYQQSTLLFVFMLGGVPLSLSLSLSQPESIINAYIELRHTHTHKSKNLLHFVKERKYIFFGWIKYSYLYVYGFPFIDLDLDLNLNSNVNEVEIS